MAQIDVTEMANLVSGDLGFRGAAEILAEMGIGQLVEELDNLSPETKLRANGMLIASIVLYALVCEAGLKMKILEMEGERDTHDLQLLYGRLPEEVRKDIRQRVAENIGADFDQMLSDNRLVNDSWQRFYQGGVNIYENYLFLCEFAKAINYHCHKVIKRDFMGMKNFLHEDKKGS